MGKTISEKIMSSHSGKDAYAGEIVVADVDYAMGQDGTTPLAIKAFSDMNAKEVFDGEKIVFVIDHNSPSQAESVSRLHKMMREFAREKGIMNFYDVGCGVCHQIMMEKHVTCGELVVGADSHTCTYGAIGAFATGIGSTDIAAVFASGKLWFKVPETIKFVVSGRLPKGVYSKDIILKLIGDVTADGATYMAAEYAGDTIRDLSVDARMTMSNMAIEMGAKTGLIEPDEKTLKWVKGHFQSKSRSSKKRCRRRICQSARLRCCGLRAPDSKTPQSGQRMRHLRSIRDKDRRSIPRHMHEREIRRPENRSRHSQRKNRKP